MAFGPGRPGESREISSAHGTRVPRRRSYPRTHTGDETMKSALLWLVGIPIPLIIIANLAGWL